MSAVPKALRNSLAALGILVGAGGGAYVATEIHDEVLRGEYVRAVAADPETSEAIKIAMVMANYYESSNRHIGTPYVDKLGKGQPLTVCNGITGPDVVPGRYYTPADCYRLEKGRYVQYERQAPTLLNHWASYGPFTRATFFDFMHNKGSGALANSTMRRDANAGNIAKACRENTRWNRGTVAGVLTVLPGLDLRARSNAEICGWEGGL